jgi:glycosyltransferase involved in cell wall biosynthesis
MKNIELSIVLPVYNEEDVIQDFTNDLQICLCKLFKESDLTYEIIFCLDPSTDSTELILKKLAEKNKEIKILKTSRKFGQPACQIAGIDNCLGKYCIVMDCDYQDPIEIIPKLHKKIKNEGLDVVNCRRKSRDEINLFYKFLTFIGYNVINALSETKIPKNVGDFRIFNRKVIDALKNLPEKNNFLKGLVSFVGFKQGFVDFERPRRLKGKSKYNSFFGALHVGIYGVICFSNFLPNLILGFAVFFTFLNFFLFFYLVIFKLNYLSTNIFNVIIIFLLNIIFLFIGILSQFILRIYDESKNRPKYIIDEKINFD